jgi:hypothetical protein
MAMPGATMVGSSFSLARTARKVSSMSPTPGLCETSRNMLIRTASRPISSVWQITSEGWKSDENLMLSVSAVIMVFYKVDSL